MAAAFTRVAARLAGVVAAAVAIADCFGGCAAIGIAAAASGAANVELAGLAAAAAAIWGAALF